MLNNNTKGIWERWNSWTEEDGFQGSSLNGLGLGSVGSFIYQYIAGINSDEEEVGFKKVIIKPHIGDGINSFQGSINTKYGIISSSMTIERNITMEVRSRFFFLVVKVNVSRSR